jgi:hypothetical protein
MGSDVLQPPDDLGPHDGRLHGPSPGLERWAGWIIDVRKRWREAGGWGLPIGLGAAAAAAIVAHVVGIWPF